MRPRLLDPSRGSVRSIEKSRRQEKVTAAGLGGSTTAGSGNKWHDKGDVKADDLLVECKTTDKKTYILHASDLKKIYGQAILKRSIGVMQVEFVDRSSWAVVPWEVFLELYANRKCKESG
jgi:hypothetical protein